MMIAGLTVESAEPVTSMESVSAREITLLTKDVGLFMGNQSASRFVAYQVYVWKARNVKKAHVFLILVVLNLTGTQNVGTKMPCARRGMVDEFVVASVVEGNIPAIDVLLLGVNGAKRYWKLHIHHWYFFSLKNWLFFAQKNLMPHVYFLLAHRSVQGSDKVSYLVSVLIST